MYNRYLATRKREEGIKKSEARRRFHLGTSSRSLDHLITGGPDGTADLEGAENCYSILVETGVFSSDAMGNVSLNHSPRDFLPVEDSYRKPNFVVDNVLEGVNLIFKEQKFS